MPMHRTLKIAVVLALPFGLAGCQRDATSSPPVAALQLEIDAGPRYSDWSAPTNLGPLVNTPLSEQGPSVSKDGLSLYFHCVGCPGNAGNSDIFVAQRASLDAPWGTPQRLGPNVNSAGLDQAPRLSRDGHRLFFSSDRPGGAGGQDLYVSRRQDKRDDFGWEPAVNLGAVNTNLDDLTPDPFEDEVTGRNALYYGFGPIGSGAVDIYMSMQLDDGSYGPGVPVAELNTSALDRQPAISRDGLQIYLASDRVGTFGGLDLWVASRATTSDPWSSPVNLGSVINSAVIDARPAISFDGTELYFQSPRQGNFDVYVSTRTKLKGAQ